MKLWINDHDFIEIDERESLTTEIAPRSRSLDWMGLAGFLPDPDPVLRKLGQDISVYRELLSDAHVWSCYQSRKSGTLSCEWELRESEDSSAASKRAFRLAKEILDALDVEQVITDMLDAPFYGMSPIEVIWKSGKGKWIPDQIVGKPPEWFVFGEENDLRFRSRDNMSDGEILPEYKFLLPRHHATYKNPYGERILSRCFWPVTFKRGGFKFWSIFTEKFGMPWIVGKVPRNTTDAERAKILSNLVSMVQDAVAVVNDDQSVEMPESSGRRTSADIYELLINAGNRECSKAILGQTLSTELDKGGSLAATKGHLEVRQDLVDADKQMVKKSFNLLFRWITELNVSGGSPPVFGFYEEEDVQKDRAERDKTLNEQGVRFTKKYYGRVYNLEEDDFEISDQQTEINNRLFSEKTPDNKFTQEDADNLSTQGAIDAQEAISALLAPVMGMIKTSTSFEEIGERLYEFYPDLDSKKFQELLAKAMFAAGLTGYAAAEGEES
ncbi:MAG: DUF935 family protein [Deltaproteobacteria bacterium]|nr:DUF935 family protein [Deltaproteobacteria bacterium]